MAKSSVGAVAQLGERLLCKQEVTGSIPVSSTRSHGVYRDRKERVSDSERRIARATREGKAACCGALE
jgi:hypothetical protein